MPPILRRSGQEDGMDAIRGGAFSAIFVVSTWIVVACAVAAVLGSLAKAKLWAPR